MALVYSISKSLTCGELTIGNEGVGSIGMSIDKYDFDTSTPLIQNWISIHANETIAPGNGHVVTLLEDGVYRITIKDGNDTEYIYDLQDCTLQACKIKYWNAILACANNNCIEEAYNVAKLYYNFSVITSLAELYTLLANPWIIGNPVPSGTVFDTTHLKRFYDIAKVLDRFSAYCTDCIEPCQNCN